jgi:N6-adenosine-specific RNA methylase IME4
MTWPFRGLQPATYGAILADPPWSFATWSGKTGTPHRGAHDHYGVAAEPDLAALPVADLALPDCCLFMWVVDSHLDVALRLGTAWGFAYKTRAFEWVKLTSTGIPKIGMGYWTRKQTESCLLFTRGKPRRVGKGVRQLIQAPRREHSRKPDEQYERIEALVAGPYCELFSRRPRERWSGWGNEYPTLEALAEQAVAAR